MMSRTVDVQEARERLTEMLTLVAGGAEIILTEREAPVAKLVPVAPEVPEARRTAGLHRGAMSASEDFDAPLPETYWTGGE